MPSGPRIRANNVYGITSDAPLTAASSTFNSVSLPLLPPVISAHAVIVFDPKRVFGDPEIVVVTIHTAASTVATILRGQYGTSAREHPQGTAWAHVPVDEDWTEILTSTTRPSDPYRGQSIFEYDTNRLVSRSTADIWQQDGFFFDPPACRAVRVTNQIITTNTDTRIQFDAPDTYDTALMHNPAVLNTRITVPVTGLYTVAAATNWVSGGTACITAIYVNGALGTNNEFRRDEGAGTFYQVVPDILYITANSFVELNVFHLSGGDRTISKATLAVVYIGRGN